MVGVMGSSFGILSLWKVISRNISHIVLVWSLRWALDTSKRRLFNVNAHDCGSDRDLGHDLDSEICRDTEESRDPSRENLSRGDFLDVPCLVSLICPSDSNSECAELRLLYPEMGPSLRGPWTSAGHCCGLWHIAPRLGCIATR